jgi:hypothetical protein
MKETDAQMDCTRITDPDKAEGKTLLPGGIVQEGEWLVLYFTDNTFLAGKKQESWGYPEVVWGAPLYRHDLRDLGLIDQTEFDRLLMLERESNRKHQEDQARAQYEILKRRFEDSSDVTRVKP